ncbi:MAG: response regulator [Lachnospiraceae bacterium]|nr:response regulator [Lachnospiraceae bacterium]
MDISIHQWFELISVIGIFITLAIFYIVVRYKSSENQKYLMLICCATFGVNFGNFFALFSDEYQGLLHALQLKTVGHIFVLTAFILFMATFSKMVIPKYLKLFLLSLNTVSICLCLTCGRNDLFFSELKYIADAEYPYLVAEPGLFYLLFRLVNLAFVVVLTVKIIYLAVKKKTREAKRNYLVVASCVAAVVGDFLTLFNIMPGYDFVAFGMAVSLIIFLFAVYKVGILDVIQVAKDDLLEKASEGLIVVNVDRELVYCNEKAREIFPYLGENDNEYINQKLQELFSEDSFMVNTADGHFEAKVKELTENGYVKGYMAWLFDLTFINKYTQEVVALKEYAEAANQSKTMFLANMSHEIRTPMNAIVGFNELIYQKSKDSEIRGYASDIKLASTNLLTIINDILDLSKIESGKMEIKCKNYVLKNLVDESAINVVSIANSKGLEFILDMDNTLPYELNGDVDHIRNILINLLKNAVKYTNEGFVKFIIKKESSDGDQVTIKFSVADSGIGIKQEDIGKVFNKFERFDSKKNTSVEGTGLGLTIVKGYVELMGGTIDVESEYGVGSTFSVTLTQKVISQVKTMEELSDQEEAVEVVRKKFRAPNARILVVDDNSTNLKVTASLLKSYGIRVELADSGRKAIEMCRTNPYDIIFMDHMMPEMDGVEAMKRIRTLVDDEAYRSVIIALTANAISGVKEQMEAEGFDGYISKPIDIVLLENMLLKFLSDELVIEVTDEEAGMESDYQMEDMPHKEHISPDKLHNAKDEDNPNPETFEQCLAGIDVKQGIINCGGDKDSYIEVLQIYYGSGEGRINDFVRFLNEKDYKSYVIAVHGLKSSSASIGAMEFSERAKRHEFAGKEERYGFIHDDVDGLLEEYKSVLSKIRRALIFEGIMEEGSEDNETQTDKIVLPEAVEEQIIGSLHQLMENYKLERIKQIYDITRACNLRYENEKLLAEVYNAIEDGDTKKALELLSAE